MNQLILRLHQRAHEPVSAAPFVSFRILFGLLMALSTLRFVALGWIEDHYLDPVIHFHYFGFSWIPSASAPLLYGIHTLMFLASLGVMTGRFYRISTWVLFLTFTYTELIDLTYYLNHYYFVSLVCLLLLIIPPPDKDFKQAAWTRYILMFQIGVVYTFAGFAKISYDWLIEALPLRIWLPAHDDLPLIGPLMREPLTAYVFSWFGMLYDCLIVWALLWKPTRAWAYVSVIVFHGLTGLLFQIGVFPLVMVCATWIFFSEEWHLRFLGFFKRLTFIRIRPKTSESVFRLSPGWLSAFLVVYMGFQVIFPWRYLLYPGNLFWTEEGYRFSWRVMLMEKAGDATFYVKDSASGREGTVNNREFLNAHQEKQMAMQADMILQFAHFLGKHYAQQGVFQPQVRAEVYVTLNARPSRLLIDPTIDLMQVNDGWAHKSWILEP